MSAPDSTERVLVIHPSDYSREQVRKLIETFDLPSLTPVWVDLSCPVGEAYAMGLLDLLRNRWQDFTLRVDAPENVE